MTEFHEYLNIYYCPSHNAICTLSTCKHLEPITNLVFHAEDHELNPFYEMSPEQQNEHWEKGIRFFEPRNPQYKITTEKSVYVKGKLNRVTEKCENFKEETK